MRKYIYKKLNQGQVNNLCIRPAVDFKSVFGTVRKVLKNVKKNGDKAVKAYTEKFDNILLNKLEVTEGEIKSACQNIPSDLMEAFSIAANNIEKFHKAQLSEGKSVETLKGIKCYSQYRAIEKIGLYIPGGTAPLPSTLLMLGIPAKIAGCKEIAMCTPPDPYGKIPDIILFAAKLVGVRKIFKIGGAQAIAALGYGTKSIPKVYKIFGPGNQYVTAAKMLMSIEQDGPAIDMPAGPSEVLIIADKCSRADFVAADLLSQAEHGKDSQVILVCDNEKKIDEILREIEKQLDKLPRKYLAEIALKNSFALKVDILNEAIDFSNLYAPEHLIINVADAGQYVGEIINAGSVFIGQYSCESAGDYASGTNHILPTYGYAKAYSGLSVESFMKKITFQELTADGIENLGDVVEKIAEVEQLQAHKNAMTLRIKSLKK